MIQVAIALRVPVTVDRLRLRRAVRQVLRDAGIRSAEISLAIVSDDEIHRLNRRYLQHDYPTDVLSFRLDDGSCPNYVDGELVVSWDTASRVANEVGWRHEDELLLYVVHGCLHLVGYQDGTASQRQQMRALEAYYLSQLDPRLGRLHLERATRGKPQAKGSRSPSRRRRQRPR